MRNADWAFGTSYRSKRRGATLVVSQGQRFSPLGTRLHSLPWPSLLLDLVGVQEGCQLVLEALAAVRRAQAVQSGLLGALADAQTLL